MSQAQTTPSTITSNSLFPHADAAAAISAAFTKKISETQGLCQPGCGGPAPVPALRHSKPRAVQDARAAQPERGRPQRAAQKRNDPAGGQSQRALAPAAVGGKARAARP